jgi:hypothetical protein
MTHRYQDLGELRRLKHRPHAWANVDDLIHAGEGWKELTGAAPAGSRSRSSPGLSSTSASTGASAWYDYLEQ